MQTPGEWEKKAPKRAHLKYSHSEHLEEGKRTALSGYSFIERDREKAGWSKFNRKKEEKEKVTVN